MRTVAAWGVAGVFLVGLGAALAGGADDATDGTAARSFSTAPTWQWKQITGLFGPKEDNDVVAVKPAPRRQAAPTKKPIAPPKPASLVEDVVAERNREEAALLRRLQACDKLKEIAIRTNDKDLLRRIEELEERAQTTYAQHTAHLQKGAGGFESDEKTIDRYLGAGKARSEETSAHTVNGKDRTTQAAIKEVKP